MTKKILLIVLIGALLALSCNVTAAVYKYIDENGSVSFVDDPSKIPEKSLKKVEKISTDPKFNWTYFNTDRDADYYYDKGTMVYRGRNFSSVTIKQSFNKGQEFYIIDAEYNCITRDVRTSTISKVATVVTDGYYNTGWVSKETQQVLLNLFCSNQ